MANVRDAMKAKSDQLNYVDIGSGELLIEVENAVISSSDNGVRVSVYYAGCNNRPYKPSKGMVRLISAAWGEETDDWIGKQMLLYGDPTVRWAGEEVGGIRIKGFSHIKKEGITEFVALSRGKRRKVHIPFFEAFLSEIDKQWIDTVSCDIVALDQIENLGYKQKIKNIVNFYRSNNA